MTVTALLGILNVHGLVDDPPLQDAPDIAQPEKRYPDDGDAETETDAPLEYCPELVPLTLPPVPADTDKVYLFGGSTAKFAVMLTVLPGIENEQGLLEEPPLHEAPDIDQLEKEYPEEGLPVTEMDVPAT